MSRSAPKDSWFEWFVERQEVKWRLDRVPWPTGLYEMKRTQDMLRVTVLGNLGSDAELRFSTKGAPIAGFRVAVNQVRTGASGQREESTEWFRINVTGRQADFAAHLQKGQRVLVAGRLQITHFQRRDESQGTGFDVWANEIQNVSGRIADAENGDGRELVAAVADADRDQDLADLSF